MVLSNDATPGPLNPIAPGTVGAKKMDHICRLARKLGRGFEFLLLAGLKALRRKWHHLFKNCAQAIFLGDFQIVGLLKI